MAENSLWARSAKARLRLEKVRREVKDRCEAFANCGSGWNTCFVNGIRRCCLTCVRELPRLLMMHIS